MRMNNDGKNFEFHSTYISGSNHIWWFSLEFHLTGLCSGFPKFEHFEGNEFSLKVELGLVSVMG
jgi:hypothetical protein